MQSRPRLFVAAAIGTVAVLATGCTSADRSDTVVGTPVAEAVAGAGEVPPGLEAFYTQQITWGSCDGFATDGDELSPTLECARVTVPLDYAAPAGDTAQIAISRAPATGARLGSILVNPGGPGASGLSSASITEGTELAERFDMIGFDPRGIGASTPQVRCLTPQESDAERRDADVDMSPAGIAYVEEKNRTYAARCAERSGLPLLAHVGTREVVRDMDVIRSVLGDAKLNYLGFSYGTRIGTQYAETFPRNVRAMVLDGALDPEQDPVEEVVLQGAGFQQAFDAFAAECVQTSNCPLGTDPSGANARFRALVDPLVARPAATTDPRGLSYSDAITGVTQALYSPSLWSSLRGGLSSLAEGNGDTLLLLADLYEGRADDGSYSNINDAFNAIRCVDDPPLTDRVVAGEADMRYREAAPFLDDGRGTGNAPLDACAFWPVPNTGAPHAIDPASVEGLPTLVVVSTTQDPATPYQAGVDLAKQLDAALVTYRGAQHTASFDGVACIDDPLTRYFVDLTVPDPDLTC
ncbi:alpha/beta hydrolase [Prescottella equi]|uniref:alpha/beta hydrolase n=1 Tax=Rhodococcus hoagii TaxID=43767 RepID=UPI000A104E9C|nr:alpha/beta hydrolase [Prescottella equi]NKR39958.1 alpha/beta fold hydrolase [Prescottella equi]NKR72796.1 alpha/beta fold hydrolase [Prescottella equi]NKS15701.1 alpha/beta fold hydrolase [Prescottella equi]NKS23470.1 alpha/beta fold hydrolase [Prescottella equi]ORJ96796.1 hydrolase [Prescottella equi]